jgi:Protein of unknown function (DUF3072)
VHRPRASYRAFSGYEVSRSDLFHYGSEGPSDRGGVLAAAVASALLNRWLASRLQRRADTGSAAPAGSTRSAPIGVGWPAYWVAGRRLSLIAARSIGALAVQLQHLGVRCVMSERSDRAQGCWATKLIFGRTDDPPPGFQEPGPELRRCILNNPGTAPTVSCMMKTRSQPQGSFPRRKAQASYLKTLSEECDERDAFAPDLTKAQAAKRIDALKAIRRPIRHR